MAASSTEHESETGDLVAEILELGNEVAAERPFDMMDSWDREVQAARERVLGLANRSNALLLRVPRTWTRVRAELTAQSEKLLNIAATMTEFLALSKDEGRIQAEAEANEEGRKSLARGLVELVGGNYDELF